MNFSPQRDKAQANRRALTTRNADSRLLLQDGALYINVTVAVVMMSDAAAAGTQRMQGARLGHVCHLTLLSYPSQQSRCQA